MEKFPPVAMLGDRLRTFMFERGFDACDTRANVAAFRRLADKLIPGPIASVDVLLRVQRKTRSSLYIRRVDGEVDGFLSIFAFSGAGERAVDAGEFSGRYVDPAHVEEPSTATRRGYVWGFGGDNRNACFAIVRALRLMRPTLFPHVHLLASAASKEGRALMAPFGHSERSDGLYGARALTTEAVR